MCYLIAKDRESHGCYVFTFTFTKTGGMKAYA